MKLPQNQYCQPVQQIICTGGGNYDQARVSLNG